VSVESVAQDVRKTGQVKFFDVRKGFGFIKPDDGSKDVFLSLNRLPKNTTGLLPDTRCSFIAAEGKKGLYAKEFVLL
jgi:CspA family cold shock protein